MSTTQGTLDEDDMFTAAMIRWHGTPQVSTHASPIAKKCSGTQDPFPYGKFDHGEESGKVIKGLRA